MAANQNEPSRIYWTHVGKKIFFEDERYCGGHKSTKRNGHKIYSRTLRAQLKREALKEIEETIND
jgi:hypothetical protein